MKSFGHGPGSASGLRGGVPQSESAQDAGHPDWLVNMVGSVVLALGAIVCQALARKLRPSSEKGAKTGMK